MSSGRTGVLLLFCLLAAGCRRDSIDVVPGPVGRVELAASSVELTPGGSAGIEFRVEGAEPGEVALRLRDGSSPKEFSLAGVSNGSGPGVYVASVRDSGVSADYSREVCVVAGGSASDFICVNCGRTEFAPSVGTGLPVVYVDTGGRPVEAKGVDYAAVIKIKGAGDYADLSPRCCWLSGRGNTSWKWDKKPYRVEFRDRVPVLGMPAHGRWVLLAGYPDRTLMRNLVAMRVSSLTSLAWTPRCVPVELVLNGRHVGNYLLTEQVDVCPERVDVSPDGGYLLELDFYYDNEVQWMDGHGFSRRLLGIPFAVKYPRGIGQEQLEYIRKYVSDTADAIYSDGFADADTGYGRWIDVESFVDYWLVFEILGNPELSNPASVYFHKDAGGKLAAGPCWDFDCCLRTVTTSVQEYAGILNRYAIWYARLFQDPAFVTRVRERFMELLPQLETVPSYIDECERLLSASADLNFAMWDPFDDRWQNIGLPINGDENLSFSDAVAQLRSVYLRRLELLKENL